MFTYSKLFTKKLNLIKKIKTGGNPLSWKINNLNSQLCLKYLVITIHKVEKFNLIANGFTLLTKKYKKTIIKVIKYTTT